MIFRRFPSFGPSVVTAAVPVTPTTPPLWTGLTGGALTWRTQAPVGIVPRLEHMYPQTVASFGQPVTFVHRVQSEFASVVATGNEVLIDSGVTL